MIQCSNDTNGLAIRLTAQLVRVRCNALLGLQSNPVALMLCASPRVSAHVRKLPIGRFDYSDRADIVRIGRNQCALLSKSAEFIKGKAEHLLSVTFTALITADVVPNMAAMDTEIVVQIVAEPDDANRFTVGVQRPENGLRDQSRAQLRRIGHVTALSKVLLQCCFSSVNRSAPESVLTVAEVGEEFLYARWRIHCCCFEFHFLVMPQRF